MEYVLNFMFYSIVVSMVQLIMICFIIIFSDAFGMSTALTTLKLDTDWSLPVFVSVLFVEQESEE